MGWPKRSSGVSSSKALVRPRSCPTPCSALRCWVCAGVAGTGVGRAGVAALSVEPGADVAPAGVAGGVVWA